MYTYILSLSDFPPTYSYIATICVITKSYIQLFIPNNFPEILPNDTDLSVFLYLPLRETFIPWRVNKFLSNF